MSNTPTKEMVEAFHKAYDASLEMQPRETSQAIYDGLSAALQSAADTLDSPHTDPTAKALRAAIDRFDALPPSKVREE